MNGRRSGPQERHLEEVRRIVLGKLKDLPAAVYLFGSCARQTAATTSDIDVAILPATPQAAARIPDVREALEESNVPFCVDVVNLAETDDELREAVLSEGIRWTA